MRRVSKNIFPLVMAGCVQFIVLTILAMLAYPGGTYQEPGTHGYRFFYNFFSDLGLSQTYSGEPKTVSFLLFTIALTLAGAALVLFFLFAPTLFKKSRPAFGLSIIGSSFGILSGLSYIGVAFTSADVYLNLHRIFVQSAFVFFFLAVLFELPAVLLTPSYPKIYAWIYLCFTILLAGYIWLLFSGPHFSTAQGLVIQATGQKVIVYAAILTMFLEAYGAWQLKRSVGD